MLDDCLLNYALRIEKIGLSFAGFQALNRVSFDVQQGHFHALIGPNGAGKTSLFNSLSGLYRPQSGQAYMQHTPLLAKPAHEICALGLVRSFQQPRLFRNLSVLDNMRRAVLGQQKRYFDFWPRANARTETAKLMSLLQQVGLASYADDQVHRLAHGQQKQLDLALCLAMQPKILLLDEPTAGMSAAETNETTRLLAQIMRQNDITVLFSEHDMDVVFDLADHVTVLQAGQVIASDIPGAISRDPLVQQAYLGTTRSHA